MREYVFLNTLFRSFYSNIPSCRFSLSEVGRPSLSMPKEDM